ncbi:hypothetical protein [Chryseobacterium mucoviscidosis]|uniref:hypothetical protein n=1 Tax=Chryseobacterium mucoviscidosis TaxID=1945581 RepID=UPI00301884D2
MDFKYKTVAEINALSPEEQEKYLADKKTHEDKVRKDEMDKMVKDALTPVLSGQTKAETDIADLSTKITKLDEAIKTINLPSGENSEMAMYKAIAEKHEEIKDIFAAGSGVIEFVVKAPATITTANGTNISVPLINGTDQAPVSNVNLRRMNIMDYVTTLPTSQASYAYTDALPKDGDFDFVDEGGVKPQIDLTWETRYATPKKIAAWEKVTEESVTDVKGFMGVAKNYLQSRHDLKKNKALLFAAGTGTLPKGATIYAKTFTAGALAATIPAPNIVDIISAGIVKIATTHNYVDEVPYKANLVLMNPVDHLILVTGAKDSQNRPLYPNGLVIPGVTIETDESIPVGKIFIGDLSKYNVTDYVSYTVKIGWVNDDFIKNQFVILGESRFHAFVKKLDEVAFIYDDIATIKTAITKP